MKKVIKKMKIYTPKQLL